MVEISFDKVVGHLLIDSMSLSDERRNFANLTSSNRLKLLSQTPSNIFLSSVAASNW